MEWKSRIKWDGMAQGIDGLATTGWVYERVSGWVADWVNHDITLASLSRETYIFAA